MSNEPVTAVICDPRNAAVDSNPLSGKYLDAIGHIVLFVLTGLLWTPFWLIDVALKPKACSPTHPPSRRYRSRVYGRTPGNASAHDRYPGIWWGQ